MYMSQMLGQQRRNELELGHPSPPRHLDAPEFSPSTSHKKPYVSDAQATSIKSYVRSCVVRLFCGNVVAVRRKATGNVSLCTTRPEVNILQAIKDVSGAASDQLNDLIKNYLPPPQFKEVAMPIRLSIKRLRELTSSVRKQFATWCLNMYHNEKSALVCLMKRVRFFTRSQMSFIR
jgi:hypothetical protein